MNSLVNLYRGVLFISGLYDIGNGIEVAPITNNVRIVIGTLRNFPLPFYCSSLENQRGCNLDWLPINFA